MKKEYVKPQIEAEENLEQTSLACNTAINLDWYTCVDRATMLQREIDCPGRIQIAKGNAWADVNSGCSLSDIVGGAGEVIGLS